MKTFDQYDFLSGIVTIRREAPADWEGKAVLPFWTAPNEDEWGRRLCRVLYHEALHFWQFLSSPYLIEVVGRLWQQLENFEARGQLAAPEALWDEEDGQAATPFTTYEIVECWARFWDVHTRNPLTIIAEEDIATDGSKLDHHGYYGDKAYDLVMTQGPNCQLYARPYRWLLEACRGNSLMANVLLPLMTNAAFSTLAPATFFHQAVQRALQSNNIKAEIAAFQNRAVNLTWLKIWDTVMMEAVAPFVTHPDQAMRPFQTAGYEAIEEGALQSHPIFRHYAIKANGSNFKTWFQFFGDMTGAADPALAEYSEWINRIARKMPVYGVYAMPGQPFYRSTLGTLVPPPRIEFQNFAWHAPRIIQVDLSGQDRHRAEDGHTFEDDYKALIPRIRRFRYALEAVKLGLPPDAFEEQSAEYRLGSGLNI